MPIASFTGAQALANLKRNPLSKWPDGRRDSTRLRGVADVEFQAKFRLVPGEAIFTMGSCFARNIEKRFGELGFDLPALGLTLPADERASDTANDLLNKYPVQSILNELRWALDPDCRFEEKALLQLQTGAWHDPHLAGNVAPADLSRVLERRAMVQDVYRQLPRCRLVVMTLGLAEAWYDTATALYLNTAPPRASILADPARFELHILSVDEIRAALESIRDLIRRYGHAETRMLVTVSPVPFKATFSGADAIRANTYSKSALRAAVEEFVRQSNDVEYFPSFEIVTQSPRSVAYIQDNRHVSPAIVETIVDRVVAACTDDPDSDNVNDYQAVALEEHSTRFLRRMIRKGRIEFALGVFHQLEILNRFSAWGYDEASFRREYAEVLTLQGRPVAALAQWLRCVELHPGSAALQFRTGMALGKLRHDHEALDYYLRAVEAEGVTARMHARLVRHLIHMDRMDDAKRRLVAAEVLFRGDPMLAEVRAEGFDRADAHVAA